MHYKAIVEIKNDNVDKTIQVFELDQRIETRQSWNSLIEICERNSFTVDVISNLLWETVDAIETKDVNEKAILGREMSKEDCKTFRKDLAKYLREFDY